ncbi:MAG: metal ABC transporter ATP-binding protein [Acidobacteriota bacterium]|nr:metal ABC transporter ATP-binding protein [Acidobacteriota bacterium]
MTAPGAPVLELDGATVSLGGRTVLDQVSFAVDAGQFTGLIGSNGAGKTTLLRTVLGLQRLDAGSVRVLGRPLAKRSGDVGYVPQKVLLDPDMPLRAWDLVALGLDGHRFGIPMPSKRRADAVDAMVAAVGAEGFAGARVGRLSGGEQQRVLIAHALVSRPRLLLLDEPLANLDLHSAQEVVGLLARVSRQQHVAVLLSAHDINPLLPVMDRVVYIAGGRAVCGTTEEVIREDVLSALYRHHVDVLTVHGRILVIAGAADLEHLSLGHHEVVGPEQRRHLSLPPEPAGDGG